MFEPNGPLPQSVYWRRRATAAGVSALAVALLAWLIGGLVGTDDHNPEDTAASSGFGVVWSAGATGSRRASTPPSGSGPHEQLSSTTASPSVPAPVSAAAPPPAAPPPPPVTTTTAVPPGPPAPCVDQAIKIVGVPDAPSYPVGARPLLRLQITNVGTVPCTRDVSRALREVVVLGADGARLWSSNDCYGPPDEDVRVLPVNQPVEFSVNWAGRTSRPGCPQDRVQVLAGNYQVVGRLGPLFSAPAPLVLV